MNNIAEWDDAQLSTHENILQSMKGLWVDISNGVTPEPNVYDMDGGLAYWDVYRPGISRDAVVAAVCQVTGFTLATLFGRQRSVRIVRPRQIACFMLSRLTKCSLVEVGVYMGGRDHTTVIHSLRVVQQKLDDGDPYTCTIYREAKRVLGA